MLGSENQVLGGFVVSIDWENDNTLQTYSAWIYVMYIYILLFNRYKASSWHNVVFYCRFQGQTDMMVRKANQQQIELISAIYIYFQVVNYYSSAFLFQFLILNKPSLWWATILGNSANIKQYTYGTWKMKLWLHPCQHMTFQTSVVSRFSQQVGQAGSHDRHCHFKLLCIHLTPK